jgi:aspartate/glutamate racemase
MRRVQRLQQKGVQAVLSGCTHPSRTLDAIELRLVKLQAEGSWAAGAVDAWCWFR